MTLNQLQQVAVTYVTRPKATTWIVVSTVGAGFLASLIYLVCNPRIANGGLPTSALFQLQLLCILPYAAGRSHLRFQFDHPRAALTPDFRAAHMAIWYGIAFVSMGIVPWAMAYGLSVSPWLLWATLALGCTIFEAPWVAAVAIPITCMLPSLLMPDAVEKVDWSRWQPWLLAEGFRLPLYVALTVGCWIVTAYKLFQSSNGRVDSAHSASSPAPWDANNICTARSLGANLDQWRRYPTTGELSWTSSQMDRRLRRIEQANDAGKLRVAMTPPIPAPKDLLLPIVTTLVFAGMWWRRMESSFTLEPASWVELLKILPVATLIAAIMPVVQVVKRRPHMTFERMLPMSNQTYADALLFNTLRLSALIWISAHATVLAATYFLPWRTALPASPATIATYGFISLSGLLFAFGFAAAMAFWLNFVSLLVTGIAVYCVAVALPWYWSELLPSEGNGGAVFMAAIAAALGIGAIIDARRSWREMELG
ncbi:hypothetical protein [Lacipirellula sp.]|uniref:hypothetical protein n=1 Tax=Lacipirellula sp. TaxID=2691419 RepID=UPI003D0DCCBD